MRIAATAFICICLLLPAALSQSRSALESQPSGWKNLLADRTLKGWVRGPLGQAGQLRAGDMNEPAPWKLDSAGEVLLCEGDRVGHEWLRWDQELGDFVAHVEWRFIKAEGEPRYNAGVFARTSTDGKIWLQAQAVLKGGYLFGSTLVDGKQARVNLMDKMTENRIKPVEEWNTYEITAEGKKVSLWVNGAVTSEFDACEVPGGYFGVEAEGYRVEYRNVMLKVR